ncbi:MAG: hypothetical protein ACLRSW_13475 [Christensenellaceae bacterium]
MGARKGGILSRRKLRGSGEASARKMMQFAANEDFELAMEYRESWRCSP